MKKFTVVSNNVKMKDHVIKTQWLKWRNLQWSLIT